jgi:hypothetical protein
MNQFLMLACEEWIVLEVARAPLGGQLGRLDRVIAKVEAEIESRRVRNWTREAAEKTTSSQEPGNAPRC